MTYLRNCQRFGRLHDLLRHAAMLKPVRPAQRWLDQARDLLAEVGAERARDLVASWLRLVDRPRTFPLVPYRSWTPINDLFDDRNAETLGALSGL